MPDQPPDQIAADLLRKADEIEREAQAKAEVTLREARREAAALRAAAETLAQASVLSAQADAALAGDATALRRLVSVSWRLPSEIDTTTMGRMDTSPIDGPTPSGPKFKTKHPLAKRAEALGKSMPQVAIEIGKVLGEDVSRPRVRSWYTTTERDARPIPEAAVKYFEKKPWGIPRGAWKNGIKS